MSDSEFATPDALLKNELTGRASNVQPVEPRYYHYEEISLSVDKMQVLHFGFCNIKRSHVDLVAPMRSLTFNYCNGMITVIRSAECNLIDVSKENAVDVQDSKKVGEGGFKRILLDGRRRYSAECQLEVG